MSVSCYGAVARREAEYLLRRRPDGGHNARLWELPSTAWHGGASEPSRAHAALSELGESSGQCWVIGEPLASVRHSITHHRVHLVAYSVEVDSSTLLDDGWCWADADAARALGLTAAARKLLAQLPSLL